jgi:glycosyltransferase involved in cell wall biosynthesis
VKVLHVIPSVAMRDGGPSRAVLDMCGALRERGVNTLIATTDADGKGRLPVELAKEISYQDVPIIFFQRQWTESYKYSHPLQHWLDAHVSDFDVVHIHAVFSHSSLAAATACRNRGVPYILRPLGTLDPWSLKQKSFKKKTIWHLGVRRMLKGASAIHYTTTTEKELAEESLGLNHGVVIPLGIDSESTNGAKLKESQGEPPSPSPYILVLSRLHPKKGLELLLPAFLSLVRRDEFKEWKLVLAGDGDAEYVQSLRDLVEKEKGNEHVIFAGWLEGNRKEAALRNASLLALTSYQENFGLCVIEALAYGVPVVVSADVNLAGEIAAANAGWITEVSASAIEKSLSDAMISESERLKRGKNGRELASHFAWPGVTDQLLELYSSITARAFHQV